MQKFDSKQNKPADFLHKIVAPAKVGGSNPGGIASAEFYPELVYTEPVEVLKD